MQLNTASNPRNGTVKRLIINETERYLSPRNDSRPPCLAEPIVGSNKCEGHSEWDLARAAFIGPGIRLVPHWNWNN